MTTTPQTTAGTKSIETTISRSEYIGGWSNDIDAWDRGTLENVAAAIATQPRRDWVNLIAQQADDSDESEAMIAAADKVLAELDRTASNDPRE